MLEEPLPQLLDACLAGDAAAQSRLVVRYHDFVRTCVARVLSRCSTQRPVAADVDDLANMVFEKLVRDSCRILEPLRGAECIDAWLYVVARNLVRDEIRREKTRLGALRQMRGAYEDEELPFIGHSRASAMDDVWDILQEGMETLSIPQRLTVQLHYVEGLDCADISQILHQPIGTVSSHLHRARVRLHEHLVRSGSPLTSTESQRHG